MTHEEVIRQLKSLIDNSKSFISDRKEDEENAFWQADIVALDKAIQAIKIVDRIVAVVYEATNLNCEGAYSCDIDEAFEAIERIIYEVEE